MTFDGIYMSTVRRNEYTGHTVFKFKYYGKSHDRNIIFCHALIPIYVRDMPLEITGEFNEKGMFEVETATEKICDNDISISYLSNKNFCGIGPKRAKAIVDKFGPNIFELVEDDTFKNKLKTIKGITEDIAQELIIKVRNTIEQRKIFEFMYKYCGNAIPAAKIADKYKINAISAIQEDPYKVCHAAGVSFYTSDAIARDLDFNYLDSKRIEGIVREALNMSMLNGNTCVTQEELFKNISFVIKNSAFLKKIPISFFASIIVKLRWLKIEIDEKNASKIFFKSIWFCEDEICRNLARLKTSSQPFNFNENIVSIIEKECNIVYHKAQRESFNILKSSGVKILTGGPGTGKTTTLNGLIDGYERLNPGKKVVLCSPTGRAAQRMREQTKRKASTIHKLLDIKPYEDSFSSRTEIDPIDADFIIVDEFSMIDIEMMSILLGAIKSNALVLFVGDTNQLPSVGPGNVMHDLINSKTIPTFKLTNVYRQSEGSLIIENSLNVIAGKSILKQNENFIIENIYDKDFNTAILEIFKKHPDFTIDNTQILSTVKRDEGGINKLNRTIQKFNNYDDCNSVFNIGDKIIINENNYQLGVYNGDIGYVKSIFDGGIQVSINEEYVTIPTSELDIVSLAYAITIHKSQGSEFDNVIIILPDTPVNMLQRNLLYTALTRAKNNVIILEKNNSLETAIKQNYVVKRNTTLCERLIKTLK